MGGVRGTSNARFRRMGLIDWVICMGARIWLDYMDIPKSNDGCGACMVGLCQKREREKGKEKLSLP